MKKHLYEIKRLNIPAYLKWWFIKYRNAGTLSEVLENLTSLITLQNSLRRKFKIFEIGGNSVQDGEPTPTNPVPIQNVTGDVEVKVENKNLISITNQEFIINGVTFKAINGKIILNGTASANITGDKFVNDNYFKIDFQSRSYVLSRTNVNSNLGVFLMGENKQQMLALGRTEQILSKDITISVAKMGYIGFFIPSGATFNNYDGGIMFSENGGDYQPHEEQTVIFPLQEGMEMCKIKTYADTFVKQESKWYKKKLIEKRTITSILQFYDDGQSNTYAFFDKPTNSKDYGNYNTNIMYSKGNTSGRGNSAMYGIVYKVGAYTEEEIREKCIGTEYYYVLKEPIYEEITDQALITQLNKIDKLYSYKDITYISSDNNPSPTFKIQYVKEDTNESTNND